MSWEWELNNGNGDDNGDGKKDKDMLSITFELLDGEIVMSGLGEGWAIVSSEYASWVIAESTDGGFYPFIVVAAFYIDRQKDEWLMQFVEVNVG